MDTRPQIKTMGLILTISRLEYKVARLRGYSDEDARELGATVAAALVAEQSLPPGKMYTDEAFEEAMEAIRPHLDNTFNALAETWSED